MCRDRAEWILIHQLNWLKAAVQLQKKQGSSSKQLLVTKNVCSITIVDGKLSMTASYDKCQEIFFCMRSDALAPSQKVPKSLVNRTSSPVRQWHCRDWLGRCWIQYRWVHRQPEYVPPQDLVYHTPHCIEVLDKNFNRLEQGGRSCAKVRRAFAEKFGFGRKF